LHYLSEAQPRDFQDKAIQLYSILAEKDLQGIKEILGQQQTPAFKTNVGIVLDKLENKKSEQ
jgi:hypothetical protein